MAIYRYVTTEERGMPLQNNYVNDFAINKCNYVISIKIICRYTCITV